MKHLGVALSLIMFAAVGCKRADPKETQMGGENARPAQPTPGQPTTAEPPIAPPGDPGEKIAPPGEPVAAGNDDGKVAKDDTFAIALDVPAEVQSGAEAVASVKITPGAGYKMNHEYPTKLSLAPIDGVTPAQATLLKADAAKFDNHEVAFNVKLTPAKAGTYTVRGTASFAVCTESTCDPKTAKIAINLVAK